MRRILVPPRPGAFSALGLLCTDVVHDYIRSELKPLAEVTPAHAEEIFAKLEHKAREELRAEGMNPADGRFARELDLRYTGQGYELRTPLEGLFGTLLTEESLAAVRDALRRAPRPDPRPCRQGAAGGAGELSAARARDRAQIPAGAGAGAGRAAPHRDRHQGPPPHASAGEDSAHAVLYERERLDIGATVSGPAIIEQFDSTTVIPPGWSGRVDAYRNLILRSE